MVRPNSLSIISNMFLDHTRTRNNCGVPCSVRFRVIAVSRWQVYSIQNCLNPTQSQLWCRITTHTLQHRQPIPRLIKPSNRTHNLIEFTCPRAHNHRLTRRHQRLKQWPIHNIRARRLVRIPRQSLGNLHQLHTKHRHDRMNPALMRTINHQCHLINRQL